jgi:AraC-like DNA-binding protein
MLPELAGLVGRYDGYELTGYPAGTHQGLPSRHLTFVLSLADPVDLAALPDPKQSPTRFQALVGGLHRAPAVIRHDGEQYGIHVRIEPFAARQLFGLPAPELAGAVFDLADVWGRRAAAELLDRLASAASWDERLNELDRFLAKRVQAAGPVPQPPGEVAWAWGRLVAAGGRVDVARLAEEVGWSRRHLSQRFGRELGLSPKVAARVLRFERSCDLLRRPEPPNLALTAALCGYYDQAHLNRDWRALAGCTPGAWLQDEVHDMVDPGSGDGYGG